MYSKNPKKIIVLLSELLKDGVNIKTIETDLKIKTSTFYKYIQYIKSAGFIVKNKKGLYRALTYAKKCEYDLKDKMIFADLILTAQNYLSKKKAKQFTESVIEIVQNSNYEAYTEIVKIYNEIKSFKIKSDKRKRLDVFQKYIAENRTLEVITNKKARLLIKPVELIYEKNKIYLNFLNKKEKVNQILSVDSFAKITPVNDCDLYIENGNEIIFEITGKLAKSYILKENERIVDVLSDKIVVANSSNNKMSLFKRLLRYDIYCKLLFPMKDVEEFRNFVKSAIININ